MPNWDKAPWAIGGEGIEHSANVARLLAYAAAGGIEGIIGTLDLEVRPLAVPGGSVRIAPGACFILNRNPTVAYDMYAGRLPVEDTVAIAATGSGSARTDLICARVMDPYLSGSPFTAPTAPEVAAGTYQFIETYVLSNIPGVTPGQHPTLAQIRAALGEQSAIPLASVALPASTGTVQATHITDQRAMAQIREQQTMKVVMPTATVSLSGVNPTRVVAGSTPVAIPAWATHVTFAGQVSGISRPAGVFGGYSRLVLGGTVIGQDTGSGDRSESGSARIDLFAADTDLAIPAAMRGTTQTLQFQFTKASSGYVTGTVDATNALRFDVVFSAKPEKRP